MTQQPEVKMELTGKIELYQDQIKQIITDFVNSKFPEMGEVKKVNFIIYDPPTDSMGYEVGCHYLGKATVELAVPYNN
jgi:hypothetical protein